MLDQYIDELKKLDCNDKDHLMQFENILEKIANLNNPSCIQLLLPFFKDDYEYDELMFSILHTIENFDDSMYVKEIIQGLPVLWSNSKRWTTIIHMRMFNSPSTLNSYQKQLNSINCEQKSIIRELLKELVSTRIEFKDRAEMINRIIV